MRRVLIVSPHFSPVNAPDMQRVRLALPHLRRLGWDPTILAVRPDFVEGAVRDCLLEKTYPADINVIRVGGIPQRFTRWCGFGSLWWRCGSALLRAGDQLLASGKFDLVFFSTTQFDTFTLGPRWRQRYRIPYVLDYQDPWVNDYYRDTGTRPPGGSLKFWFSQCSARRREPGVLKSASGIIAVSPTYGPALQRRYPWFSAARVKTIPFGSSPIDLDIARNHPPKYSLVPFGDGNWHHVYTGRCGHDMAIALTILFRAFKRYLNTHPAEAARHRFHFIGTDYAPPPLGHDWALPLAEREGILPHVTEHRYRVPYFEALHYLTQANAIMVVGSDDPTYSASKIYPYLFSQRPLLTIAHAQSPMLELVRGQGYTCSFGFTNKPGGQMDDLITQVHEQWFVADGCTAIPEGNPALLAPHTAQAMSHQLADTFNQAVMPAAKR